MVANDKVIYIDEELQYNIKTYKTKTAIQNAMLKKMQSKNIKEIVTLTKQRDELLPLLMNGQISPLNCD